MMHVINWYRDDCVGNDGRRLFLFFSVFWDLYCAAPERRDNCEHSSEAKAFHDYVSASLLTVRFLTCVQAAGRQQHAYISMLIGQKVLIRFRQ